jgi:transcriptional regulator with XRE-family HTH domain
MDSNKRLGDALRQLRLAGRLTQEDFGTVSSRTYISTVERGLKSPTLGKLEQIASVLGIHPLTLITLAFSGTNDLTDIDTLLKRVRTELDAAFLAK